MRLSSVLIDQDACRRCVVVRWKLENSCSNVAFVSKLSCLGYNIVDSRTLSTHNAKSETSAILLMESQDEANKLCFDMSLTRSEISTNPLVDLNGIHIQDANEIIKAVMLEESSTDEELMNLLTTIICLEDPRRKLIAQEELKIIENAISKIIEHGICTIFGSYSSPVRRNGYSDIDLAVSAESTGSDSIRSLQTVIENPKCLLETPLTCSELFSFPQEETIKAVYQCFVDNEEFRERFEMKTLLVRTPIVIFKSTAIPDMKMSYDLSINNQISVEKAKILSDFISSDESDGNKMRNAVMFIIHWAKTNKLLGGAYSDEKLERKFKFNSYIFNHLIIHFVQVAANQSLVNTLAAPEFRVKHYNFDEIFKGYYGLLKDFFSYYLKFDYENMGIFGIHIIEKSKLAAIQAVLESPLLIIDPLDTSHNISEKVIPKGVSLFKSLMDESLQKMTKEKFRITDLL